MIKAKRGEEEEQTNKEEKNEKWKKAYPIKDKKYKITWKSLETNGRTDRCVNGCNYGWTHPFMQLLYGGIGNFVDLWIFTLGGFALSFFTRFFYGAKIWFSPSMRIHQLCWSAADCWRKKLQSSNESLKNGLEGFKRTNFDFENVFSKQVFQVRVRLFHFHENIMIPN